MSIAHAARNAEFTMAQRGKVNIITHVHLDLPLDEPVAKLMKDESRVCVPTLVMEEIISKAGIFPGLNYGAAKESVIQLHKAGMLILAGTDSNKSPIAGVKHGEVIHRELNLLVDAGLSNEEALRAATTLPEKWSGLEDKRVVVVGKRADFVLVGG